jgi:hypothetical protein
MKKQLLAVGLLALPLANAGEIAAPLTPPPPMMESTSILSGALSGGWESSYMFRGVNYGNQAIWAGLDLNVAISDMVTLNFGTWYINPTDDFPGAQFDELDLYAFLNFAVTEEFTIGIGGTWYFYPEAGISDYPEVGVKLAWSPGDIVDIGFLWMYDTNVTANYFELTVGKSFSITEKLTASITAGISYGLGGGAGYYGVDSFNHVFVKGGLSYAITDTFSINGYIGDTIPIEDLAGLGAPEVFHGGVSVSVTF